MEKPQLILKSLDYIEKNLKEPLNSADIAKYAGYSVYHFSRIFKKEMKMSVMEYVTKRRLVRASYEISSGRRILDTALDYGYESHSGFTRAFQREFGFSPALLKAFGLQISYLKGEKQMGIFLTSTEIHADKEDLYYILIDLITKNGLKCNQEKINKAYVIACQAYEGQTRYSGDEYVTHPLNVAILLAQMEADEDLIAAGLLCDALSKGTLSRDTNLSEESISRRISKRTAELLVQAARLESETPENIEDGAVMLKLAEWLHNMRTLEYMDESKWKEKAAKTICRFLPLASRPGMEPLAAELNELAVRYSG